MTIVSPSPLVPVFPGGGWIKASDRAPRPGFIVKRWKNGALWAGYYHGDTKSASCDWWYPLPPF